MLGAFELLLEEAGGCLSDVYGAPLGDVQADGVQERGILACVDSCQNYLLRSMAVAFPPFRCHTQLGWLCGGVRRDV